MRTPGLLGPDAQFSEYSTQGTGADSLLPLGRITFAYSDRNGMPSFELATRAGYDAAREAPAIVKGKAPSA